MADRRHIASLDGLRAAAILSVLAYHSVALAQRATTLPARALYGGAAAGWMGVDLFFVLSGFLITGILLDARGTDRYYRTFFIRRALRILPLYYAAVALLVFLSPLLPGQAGEEGRALWALQGWYWAHGVNILQALHGFDVAPLKTAHFWSLAVEEQFYLVWPFVVAALPTRRLARVTLVMVVGAPALRLVLELAQAPAAALYTLPVTRMDALAIGAYLAARVRLEGGAAEAVHAFRRAAIPAAITLAGVVAMARTFELSTRAMRLGGYTAVAVLAGWVVAEALTARADGCLSRALGWSPLARLAQRSYAIYVLHFPLLALAAAAGLGAEPMSRALRSQVAGGLAWLVLVTAVTYALATVSWHVLEAPLLRFKDRLAPPERAREAPQGGVRAPGTVLTPCQQSLTASDSA